MSMWFCQPEVTEWFIWPAVLGSQSRSKSSLLCSHFSPADNQALRGMPRVINQTWFICLSFHHKEATFQISARKFHSPWFPNFDYLQNDPLWQTSISTHSLLTFTMSALNKNPGTINSVIPQIRNPICLLMEKDWMRQVSSHPARMNMQITSICFESQVVLVVHGENQIQQRLQTPYLLGLSQNTVYCDFRSAVTMCFMRTTRCAITHISYCEAGISQPHCGKQHDRWEDISPPNRGCMTCI